jgi:hypothetical protein
LAITNTLQGVVDFFSIYNNGGLKNGQHLIPSLRYRKHIDNLIPKGYLNRWHRKWWLEVYYSVFVVASILLDQIGDDDIIEAILY